MNDSYITNDVSSDGTSAPALPSRDLPELPDPDLGVLRGADSESEPGSGDVETGATESILGRAAALRFPNLRDLAPRERIDALIDYITDTAIARGELEELRLEAHVRLRDARERLAAVTVTASRSASKVAVEELRRQAAPKLAHEVDSARWVVERCTEQIMRLGGTDYDAASRTYTLLSGS